MADEYPLFTENAYIYNDWLKNFDETQFSIKYDELLQALINL